MSQITDVLIRFGGSLLISSMIFKSTLHLFKFFTYLKFQTHNSEGVLRDQQNDEPKNNGVWMLFFSCTGRDTFLIDSSRSWQLCNIKKQYTQVLDIKKFNKMCAQCLEFEAARNLCHNGNEIIIVFEIDCNMMSGYMFNEIAHLSAEIHAKKISLL